MRIAQVIELTKKIFSMKDLIAAGVRGEADVDKFLYSLVEPEKTAVKTEILKFHREFLEHVNSFCSSRDQIIAEFCNAFLGELSDGPEFIEEKSVPKIKRTDTGMPGIPLPPKGKEIRANKEDAKMLKKVLDGIRIFLLKYDSMADFFVAEVAGLNHLKIPRIASLERIADQYKQYLYPNLIDNDTDTEQEDEEDSSAAVAVQPVSLKVGNIRLFRQISDKRPAEEDNSEGPVKEAKRQ